MLSARPRAVSPGSLRSFPQAGSAPAPMGAAPPASIVRRMSTLHLRPEHERPTPVVPVLVSIVAVTLGSYVLLGALALAERAHGRWGLGLVPLAVVCFAVAAVEARALYRRS